MSLDSIIEHILNQARLEAKSLIAEARKVADKDIQEARREAEALYQALLEKEKSLLEANKQKLIVNARLESKKNILLAKQKLIDNAFGQIKVELAKVRPSKQKISREKIEEVSEDLDFYLKQFRPEHEHRIAQVLFT